MDRHGGADGHLLLPLQRHLGRLRLGSTGWCWRCVAQPPPMVPPMTPKLATIRAHMRGPRGVRRLGEWGMALRGP